MTPSAESDFELLRAYVDHGSESAFGELVSRHLNLVYATALRKLANASLAEEVAQTVFILLAKKAHTLSPKVILAGWLHHTTVFASNAAIRSQQRREHREHQFMASGPNEENEPLWKEIAPQLETALTSLRDADRCALLLYYFEQKSFRDVGLVLGISEDAAQKRVERALPKLRVLLSKWAPIASVAVLNQLLLANGVQAAPPALSATATAVSLSGATLASASVHSNLVSLTLKSMAWTQLKTGITAAAITLIAVGILSLSILPFGGTTRSTGEKFVGAWEGDLHVGEATMRLVARIQSATNGQWTGFIDSIDQGTGNIAMSSLSFRRQQGVFELASLGAKFEGTLDPLGNTWKGQWLQASNRFDITFRKTTTPSRIPTSTAMDIRPKEGSDLQGYWKGSLFIGAIQLRLGFRISEPTPGEFVGTMDSIDQGVHRVPITSIQYSKPHLEMDLQGLGGHFEGTYRREDKTIEGKWSQVGKTLDLVLELGEEEAQPTQVNAEPQTDSDLQGIWEGILSIQTTRLRLELKLAKQANGKFSGWLISLDQGAQEIPASKIVYNPPHVRLEWPGIGASFDGTHETNRMEGTFKQGPLRTPLEFKRKKSP